MPRLLLFILLSISFVSHAQYGIQVAQLRPSGELGSIMENQVGFGVNITHDLFDTWRSSFVFNYFNMQPRLDVFPVTGTISGGGGPTFVSLGEQTFHKFALYFLDGTWDYAVLDKDPFYLFAGAGLTIGGASIEYSSFHPRISEEGFMGGGLIAGFHGRIGAEYVIGEVFALRLYTDRRYFLLTESGYYSANSIAFGATYFFD